MARDSTPPAAAASHSALLSRGQGLLVAEDQLRQYDDLVRTHLAAINRNRRRAPITLRYFQYLAALATEHYLRLRSEGRAALLASLNETVDSFNESVATAQPILPRFDDRDLDRLAFWMATGSGKTLLLHLNYRQYLHYEKRALDNILLVTPNEGLSDQHIRAAHRSGISAERFGAPPRLASNPIRVIEITKLVEEKRGAGVSVPVDAFEGRNLIFVDEGHKGSGGEAWRKVRDALAATGFTFEYSATFGQALAAAKDDQLTQRYGKAILFDYSYRWFYEDGHGKDFRILDLERDEGNANARDILLLGGLLTFHEQGTVFDRDRVAFAPYHIGRPLWAFVGGTVSGVNREGGKRRSDVLNVCRFLHRFLSDRHWAEHGIQRILDGTVSEVLGKDRDFRDRLQVLRSRQQSPSELYDEICRSTFHTSGGGALQLCRVKRSDGEFVLRATGVDRPFGVVTVGDPSALLRLARNEAADLVGPDDAVSDPLFSTINDSDSPIRVLVGAKKFIEGWNSWRVSSMGLLNIGRAEGSQIIQLFGRGVRLRGLDFTMKRSQAFPGIPHPPRLPVLETLQIFGVRSSYMAKFREHLLDGRVPIPVRLPLPVRVRSGLLRRGLVIPRVEASFLDESAAFWIGSEPGFEGVTLDITVRVREVRSGGAETFEEVAAARPTPERIPEAKLRLLDWEAVRLALLDHVRVRGYRSAVVREADLLHVARKRCRLAAPVGVLRRETWDGVERLQDAVIRVLRKYVDHEWRRRKQRWEAGRMTFLELTAKDRNLTLGQDLEAGESPHMVLAVSADDADEIRKDVSRLVSAQDSLTDPSQLGLRRLRCLEFDQHLYEPLLTEGPTAQARWGASPPALNEGEARFVRNLKEFGDAGGFARYGAEVFLLRNLTRGAGIGFFETHGFYPDFVLWLLKDDRQHLVFIEPHGMLPAPAYQNDEKARLHERLPELARQATKRSGGLDARLDSYILSRTPFQKLRPNYDSGDWDKERFEKHHILFFPEDEASSSWPYLERIFTDQLGASASVAAGAAGSNHDSVLATSDRSASEDGAP